MDFLLFVVYRTTWAGGSEESGEDSGDLLGGPSGVRDEPPDATNDGIRQAPVRPHGIAHSWQPQLGNVLLAQIEEQEAPSVPCRNLGRSLVKQRQDFCFLFVHQIRRISPIISSPLFFLSDPPSFLLRQYLFVLFCGASSVPERKAHTRIRHVKFIELIFFF